jgi:hypothetical protein
MQMSITIAFLIIWQHLLKAGTAEVLRPATEGLCPLYCT